MSELPELPLISSSEKNGGDVTAAMLFGFTPTLALAATALALFSILTIVLVVQCTHYFHRVPSKRLAYLLTLPPLIEAAAYALIVVCAVLPGSVIGPFVASQTLLMTAPNMVQALEYLILGRLGQAADCPPALRKGAGLFWWADLLLILMQTVGVTVASVNQASSNPSTSTIKAGYLVVFVGLVLQLASFCIFLGAAAWATRRPEMRALQASNKSIICLQWGMFISSALVLARNLYRLVEFGQVLFMSWPPPPGVYVLRYQQVLLYVMDTLPMLLVFLVLCLTNPLRLLPADGLLPQKASPAQPAT